jgi:hypothetical protein
MGLAFRSAPIRFDQSKLPLARQSAPRNRVLPALVRCALVVVDGCATIKSMIWYFLTVTKIILSFSHRNVAVLLLIGGWTPFFGLVSCSGQDISFSRPDADSSISVAADAISRWQVGHYEVLHLFGSVRVQQVNTVAEADEAILWVERPSVSGNGIHKIIAYLEGQVVIEIPRPGDPHDLTGSAVDRIVDEQWQGRFFTRHTVNLNRVAQDSSRPAPPIFERAQMALQNGLVSSVQPTSFAQAQGQFVVSPQTGAIQQIVPATPSIQVPEFQDQGSPVPENLPDRNVWPADSYPATQSISPAQSGEFANSAGSGPGFSVSVSPRDSTGAPNLKFFANPNNPNERVSLGVGGFRVVITSPEIDALGPLQGDRDRQVIILADNIVQWQSTLPDGTTSNQVYVEGNVVFAKDRRVIYAQKMFYDAERQTGTILDVEMLTPVPQYQGLVRLKAQVVQQVDANNLQAHGAAVTTSRLGVPSYWLQSGTVSINRQTVAATDPETELPLFDPVTGAQQTEDEYFLETERNRVYLAGVPVFAWPRLRTKLEDSSLYLERLGINNDNMFGFQVTTGWDLYQLLGFRNPPKDARWIGILDYLSDRGIAWGSEYEFQRNGFLGIPGRVNGQYLSWFIRDKGLDNLGFGRRSLVPEEENRGRILGQYRHRFSTGFELKSELGYISDRNFLEQYYEREWDTGKDATTGLWLQRNFGTQSLNLTADIQINDFFAQTSWLPRLDHFALGQPLFNDRAVWFGHSQVGYGKLQAANAPLNASELAIFNPLPWEADVEGVRAGTRQELDFPVQLGPVKVVPYVLGDVSFWQQDLTGNNITRTYGQAGVRASLPFWKVDPTIQNVLLNLNGLAHKVTFDLDAFYADASQDLDQFPLYDQLDDDAQEHFRRRFPFNSFGIPVTGNMPLKFDERYFALRSGMQGNVTAPSAEIADDLSLVRLGVRQRWQTKRGMPGTERIVDWISFDMQTMLYPDADRDNFGSVGGMFDYDFQWQLGDRLSLISDGFFDFFADGLRTASFGASIGRPETGNAYVGFRSIEGPISSNILTANLIYQMSEKWGVKAGGQVDFGATGSIGQTASVVYIGESFLWQAGINYDVSRDNVAFRFGFEPRFSARPRLFRPGGTAIPPAGARYLE